MISDALEIDNQHVVAGNLADPKVARYHILADITSWEGTGEFI